MSETATETPAAPDPLEQLAADEAAEVAAREGAAGEPAENGTTEAPPEETPQEAAERMFAGKFRGENALEQGYLNVEQELGRVRNELGQERAKREAYERAYQPPPGEEQQVQDSWPEGLPQLSEQEVEQMFYGENPLSAVAYIATLVAAATEQRIREEFSDSLRPVMSTVNQSAAASAVQQLKDQFGDAVVLRNKEAIAAALENDPEFYRDPATRLQRLRMTVQASEYERANGTRHAERAPENGQFAPAGEHRTAHVEGGSTNGPQPPQGGPQTPEEEIIAEMDALQPPEDAFGHPAGRAAL